MVYYIVVCSLLVLQVLAALGMRLVANRFSLSRFAWHLVADWM